MTERDDTMEQQQHHVPPTTSPREVKAYTHLVLAYPAWVQYKINPSNLAIVKDLVKGERKIDMRTVTELTRLNHMTVAKALIRLGYLRVNESIKLEGSTWEYAPQLAPQVWYAKPTGRQVRRVPTAAPRAHVQETAAEIQLPVVGEQHADESWTLDLSSVDTEATIKDLIAYAKLLGVEVEVRLRRKA